MVRDHAAVVDDDVEGKADLVKEGGDSLASLVEIDGEEGEFVAEGVVDSL